MIETYREGAADKKCSKCKKGGKKCSKCSHEKEESMKEDGLSVDEYLAACELRIQNQSRPYIRARLDAAGAKTKGKGVKCGNGYISQGETCGKGGAVRQAIENVAIKGGGKVSTLGFGGGIAATLMGRPQAANALFRASTVGSAVEAGGLMAKGRRTKNEKLEKLGKNRLTGIAVGEALGYGFNRGIRHAVNKHAAGKAAQAKRPRLGKSLPPAGGTPSG
jgi:hypothetical protein